MDQLVLELKGFEQVATDEIIIAAVGNHVDAVKALQHLKDWASCLDKFQTRGQRLKVILHIRRFHKLLVSPVAQHQNKHLVEVLVNWMLPASGGSQALVVLCATLVLYFVKGPRVVSSKDTLEPHWKDTACKELLVGWKGPTAVNEHFCALLLAMMNGPLKCEVGGLDGLRFQLPGDASQAVTTEFRECTEQIQDLGFEIVSALAARPMGGDESHQAFFFERVFPRFKDCAWLLVFKTNPGHCDGLVAQLGAVRGPAFLTSLGNLFAAFCGHSHDTASLFATWHGEDSAAFHAYSEWAIGGGATGGYANAFIGWGLHAQDPAARTEQSELLWKTHDWALCVLRATLAVLAFVNYRSRLPGFNKDEGRNISFPIAGFLVDRLNGDVAVGKGLHNLVYNSPCGSQ
jgi:hypothetical protein